MALKHADSSDKAYSFFEELLKSSEPFHKITDWGMFLGDAVGAGDKRALDKHDIKAVVCCHPNIPFFFESSGIEYHRCAVLDTPMFELKPHYDPAIIFIRKCYREKKNVLIHCQKGISRSSALVISYVMKYGWGSVDREEDPTLAGKYANKEPPLDGSTRDIDRSHDTDSRDGRRGGRDDNSRDDRRGRSRSRRKGRSRSREPANNPKTANKRDPFQQPYSYDEVFAEVERKRSTAFPNIGFQQQLRLYFDYSRRRAGYLNSTASNGTASSARNGENGENKDNSSNPGSSGPIPISRPDAFMGSYRFEKMLIVDGVKSQIKQRFLDAENIVKAVLDDDAAISKLGSSDRGKAQWKRIGLFFENLHKYEFIDEFVTITEMGYIEKSSGNGSGGGGKLKKTDANSEKSFSVLERGEEVVRKMKNIERVLSPTLDGVKLALNLAKEIEAWLKMIRWETNMKNQVKRKREESIERATAKERQKKEKKAQKKAAKKERKRLKKEKKKEKKRLKKERKLAERMTTRGRLDRKMQALRGKLEDLGGDTSSDSDSSSSSSSLSRSSNSDSSDGGKKKKNKGGSSKGKAATTSPQKSAKDAPDSSKPKDIQPPRRTRSDDIDRTKAITDTEAKATDIEMKSTRGRSSERDREFYREKRDLRYREDDRRETDDRYKEDERRRGDVDTDRDDRRRTDNRDRDDRPQRDSDDRRDHDDGHKDDDRGRREQKDDRRERDDRRDRNENDRRSYEPRDRDRANKEDRDARNAERDRGDRRHCDGENRDDRERETKETRHRDDRREREDRRDLGRLDRADTDRTDRERNDRRDRDRSDKDGENPYDRDHTNRDRSDRTERDRTDRDRVDRDRNVRTERDRADRDRVDRDRNVRTEGDRADKDRPERDRIDRERAGRDKIERTDRDHIDRDRQDRDRNDRARNDRDRIDRDRNERRDERRDDRRDDRDDRARDRRGRSPGMDYIHSRDAEAKKKTTDVNFCSRAREDLR